MSFAKGCYIGQEILSRIKTTGKMPRELMAWTAESGDADLVVGADLVLADKKVGQITSLTRDPQSGRTVGLGYIRQGAAAVDSVLLVGSEVFSIAASVKISALLNQ
jgi:folate-binding Fe-S cluster repair protein YgfZ